jgi:hypothetical protein
VYQEINGIGTQLELQTDCNIGKYCFKKSTINSRATIYGSSKTAYYGAINI